jgi:hypothetical protein
MRLDPLEKGRDCWHNAIAGSDALTQFRHTVRLIDSQG